MIAVSVSFLLSCLLFFKKYVPLYIKGFTPFLFLSLIVEIIGTLQIRRNVSNTLTYNLSTSIEITFYLWVLLNLLKGKFLKRFILGCIVIYPIISGLDIFFIQGKDSFHSVGYALGCLLIVFFTIIFFYQLFAKPEATRLSKDSAFWIATGLLLFYSVSFPLFVFVNFMKTFPAILANNLQYILIVLNVFLYLLFSIAFLCRITIKKS